jgi:hypothetical protein
MSDNPKIYSFDSMKNIVARIRDDLRTQDFVLLFAYNGTGKTRLSMEFKDAGKTKRKRPMRAGDNSGQSLVSEDILRDTLYYNAFTEDLFSWDNDLDGDNERVLRINSESRFFSGLKELALEEKISDYFERYSKINFRIDYEGWTVSFSQGDATNIKVSRGEENLFIWCVFLAICELVIEGSVSYKDIKYLYIDDPISSLDDNNAIAVASDLAKLLRKGHDRIKAVISSHHGLFFNVMFNELRSSRSDSGSKSKCKSYFYHRVPDSDKYTLRSTDDTPFYLHVAMLSELNNAAKTGQLYTYHFNMLRSILEKTATFFGYDDFSACILGVDDEVLYARALNLLSHGKYSIYEPREMGDDTKDLFRRILQAFETRYTFNLPEINAEKPKEELNI